MPLEEFAPATTWILKEIPIENLNWNSHGRRSKLLQRPWLICFCVGVPCWNDPYPDHSSRCTKYIAISPFPFAWIMPRGINTNPGVSLMC